MFRRSARAARISCASEQNRLLIQRWDGCLRFCNADSLLYYLGFSFGVIPVFVDR